MNTDITQIAFRFVFATEMAAAWFVIDKPPFNNVVLEWGALSFFNVMRLFVIEVLTMSLRNGYNSTITINNSICFSAYFIDIS